MAGVHIGQRPGGDVEHAEKQSDEHVRIGMCNGDILVGQLDRGHRDDVGQQAGAASDGGAGTLSPCLPCRKGLLRSALAGRKSG